MGIVMMGLSHKTAPVEIREKLNIPLPQLGEALDRLKASPELSEAVILSTCNRLEVYARPVSEKTKTLESIAGFLIERYQQPHLENALYHCQSQLAVNHLFRVASGLDSLVVGESEILGQVKASYQFAQRHGTTGKITNVLFQRALFVGKNVRTKTAISEGSSSVGSVGVQLAERIFGSLHQKKVLLIGAGKIAEVTARHLLSQKATDILVLNRTLEKAEELAKLLNGKAAPLSYLSEALTEADIVICSTSSDKPIIKKHEIETLMKVRKGHSLYFIDIALPRNVESEVHDIDNAYVYNLDDLKNIVDENMGKRKEVVQEAESIVEKSASDFYDWIRATLEGRSHALRHTPSEKQLG
ncbi:MAG: glutamyl-tRNA reductase [Elusimicrobiota bacterium]